MAEGKATFTIALEDDASDAVDGISGALRKLQSEIKSDTRAVSEMQRALKNLKLATTPNEVAIKKLGDEIAVRKERIAAAQQQFIDLGGVFGKVGGSAKRLKQDIGGSLDKAGGALGKAGAKAKQMKLDIVGALKEISPGIGRLAEQFMKMKAGVVGVVGVVAALAYGVYRLGRAIVTATKQFAGYIVAAGNARRAELLQLEGVSRLRTLWSMAFGLGRDDAKAMQKAIDGVTRSTAINREQAVGLYTTIERAGLRGKNAQSALQGLAIVQATQGDEQVQRWLEWYRIIGLGGGAVDKLTARIKRDLGGIAKAQLLDTNVMAERLNDNLDHLWDDVDLTPYLMVRRALVDMTDQATVWGRTLRRAGESFGKPLIAAVTLGLKATERFFVGVTIGALYVEKAWLKLRGLWLKLFGKPTFDDATALWDIFVYAGIAAITLLAIPLAFIGGTFAVFGIAVFALYYAVKQTYDALKTAIGWARDYDWAALGKSIGDGIAKGIKYAFAAISDAIKWVSARAQAVFRGELKIQSPSQVFADLGKQISLGVAQGVMQSQPALADALAGLASIPPITGAPGGPVPPLGGALGGPTTNVNIREIVINTDEKSLADAGGMAELANQLKRELERAMLDLAISMGAQPA